MTEQLPRIPARRRIGSERFTDAERDLGFDLLGFWQWSVSDLVGNTARGVVAEYLVARALEIDVSGVRDAWAPYDLRTPSGVRVEVKSASYLQSWHQTKLSTVSFRTPKTRAWDPDTNQIEAESRRQSDVYVFPILKHPDKRISTRLMPVSGSSMYFRRRSWISESGASIPSRSRLSGESRLVR